MISQRSLRPMFLCVAILMTFVWVESAVAQLPVRANFSADRTRVAPGWPIKFFDQSEGHDPVNNVWTFTNVTTGTVTVSTNQINGILTMQFAELGMYTVQLRAASTRGSNTIENINFFQVMNPPFADFVASPVFGGAPLTVQFTDTSNPGGLPVTSYLWNFGDAAPTTSAEQNPVFAYTAQGTYTVSRTATDPAPNPYATITVGQAPAEPTASVAVTDMVKDTQAVLPLNDWQPLFSVQFTTDEQTPAVRFMAELDYSLLFDPKAADRAYDVFLPPREADILEFGLFAEGILPGQDAPNQVLDYVDSLIATWDGTGAPYDKTSAGDERYKIDMLKVQNAIGQTVGTLSLSSSYVLAFRTSAVLRNTTGISHQVNNVSLFEGSCGCVPRGDDGNPIDSYPEFPVASGGAYSSSFGVYDVTGSWNASRFWDEVNTGYQPNFIHTPLAENTRPRWDLPGTFVEFTAGEFMDLRHVMSLETWTAVLGINVHAGVAPAVASGGEYGRIIDQTEAMLTEVNVVLTDIGADPNGPPGNGGFNPNTMLEHMTTRAINDVDRAEGIDFAYNGIWVYNDTNNNGLFDVPTQDQTNGMTFAGDYPMNPDGLYSWEYDPFPPGGGDPWWKIRLRLYDGRRRLTGTSGNVEPTPERGSGSSIWAWGDSPTSSFMCDYFVVVRPDSGYIDSSRYPGDGTGMRPGADFKAFIEPRRYNPHIQALDGGIFVDSQVPDPWSGWQNDFRWGLSEPWWPQRTHNQDTVKVVGTGVAVHDLVMTYSTNNIQARNLLRSEYLSYLGQAEDDIEQTDSWLLDRLYGLGKGELSSGGSFLFGLSPTNLDRWMDPFGARMRNLFYDEHSPGTMKPIFEYSIFLGGNFYAMTDDFLTHSQFSYETVPFFISGRDLPPNGPRSAFYAFPPTAPTAPTYSTWMPFQNPPATLPVGQYPRATDWRPQDRAARILRQHTDILSRPTPLLGFALAAANDPATNRLNQQYLNQVTVAFWGTDFQPTDLAALDPSGVSLSSGILLYEDADGDGIFGGELGLDRVVPLSNLQWPDAPEFVNVDGQVDQSGNWAPNDINGDGLLNDKDKAWVVRLDFNTRWRVPNSNSVVGSSLRKAAQEKAAKRGDVGEDAAPDALEADSPVVSAERKSRASAKKTLLIDVEKAQAAAGREKVLTPSGSEGDNLFLVVSTSDSLKRFEAFKAFVPAGLPSRGTPDQQVAGFRFEPQTYSSAGAFLKAHPEESPFQGFYENEMLVANVACKIVNLTGPDQKIQRSSQPIAVLGLDVSTNRGAEGTAASGGFGFGGTGQFNVSGANWAPNAYAGYWLVDSAYKSFEILSNTSNQLVLRGGMPSDGRWQIAIDPTFLEQVIVELYDIAGSGVFGFNDVLPLDKDQAKSGVALYRDNRFNPANRQGQFDPGIDIPIELDDPPAYIGNVGENRKQVKFVFSSPGTDNLPVPLADQPQLRQWVPDSFGRTLADADYGPEFFVVLRTSSTISYGDRFRVAIVSWGPSTPTEPDPDQFTDPPPPIQPPDEYDIFSEFPWGERAVGFITMFKEAPDPSGFKWIRSTVAQAKQTNIITVEERVPGPNDVVIDSTSTSKVPTVTPAGGFTLAVYGSGFGSAPQVTIGGVAVTRTGGTDNSISLLIPGGTTYPLGSLVLTVRNVANGNSASRVDLLRAVNETFPDGPRITSVSPSQGVGSDFPVEIYGANFDQPVVYFGTTLMPIISWTPTKITVGFPVTGITTTGALDVTVRNGSSQQADVAVRAFTYLNAPVTPARRACFIATAAYGTPFADRLGTFRVFRDDVLLKSAAGTALVEGYYATSPAIADYVATHPGAARVVRGVLTPLAWLLEGPVLSLTPFGLFALGLVVRRRRACRASARR